MPDDKNTHWQLDTDEDDLDELYTPVKDKDTVDDLDEPSGFIDPWETEPGYIPDIHEKRFDEVIQNGYPGDSKEKTRTGGILCPKALDLAWRLIKRSGKGWTKARVQRASIYHGVRIAYHDSEIKAIMRTYNKLLKASQSLDDDDLIDALSMRNTYGFRDPHPKTTSMGTLAPLEGAISDLADCLGIAKSNMYPILSLVSIATYEPLMWPVPLGKEYQSFKKIVCERQEKLEKEYRRITSEAK